VPDEDAVAGQRTRRGKRRLPNTPLIRDLVQFFIESEVIIIMVVVIIIVN
jgi:cohesin complex subunit SA-1/2